MDPKLSDEDGRDDWESDDWSQHLIDGVDPTIERENVERELAREADRLARESAEYPPDWGTISTDMKVARRWTCEECRFTLCGSPTIQVHHLNKDKRDNSVGNLQVLCSRCHGAKHNTDQLSGYAAPQDIAKLNDWHMNIDRHGRQASESACTLKVGSPGLADGFVSPFITSAKKTN